MGFVLLALAASACAKGGAGPEADAGPGADGGERDAQAGDAGADAEPADGETDAPPPECTLGADCDDLDPCNGLETCEAGACTPGTPPSCEDGLACSLDSCDPATGECVNALDDSLCADGEVCDSIEGCVLPPPCLVDADCDDGLFCTGIESCDPATGCLRSPPSCDDGLACTDDLCDAGLDACVNTPRDSACSDGVVCNGAESCAPGDPLADGAGCVIGSPPVCDDGVGCTTDYCDESLGGCVVSPDHGACDDLSFCNGVEICDAILGCLEGTAPDCADAIGCTAGRCDALLDRCVQEPDDAACDDGLVCNGAETCDTSGATPGMGCRPGAPFDCGDGLVCTTDLCLEPGVCEHGGSDADGDGHIALGCGVGDDCDDTLESVHPGAVEICDGVDNDCSGGVDDGAGMECALGSAAASCTTSCGSAGLQVCNAICRLGACIGVAEICNGCDDDANGLIDDGLGCRQGASASCTTSCGTPGSQLCAADCSGWGACAAAAETCNDCDDDGDGAIDEGLGCRRSSAEACTTACGTSGTQVCAVDCSGYGACRALEACNGCDDDSDGAADEDFACVQGSARSCVTSCGSSGSQACAADCSGWGACVATEICNGCDDDADGSTDEGFTCAQSQMRGCVTSCGTDGSQICNASCTAFSACAAVAETCNGCDDDADGASDEDFTCVQGSTRSCTTSCGTSGSQACSADCSGWGACVASEICNGCDDDGDGASDEDFLCAQSSAASCVTGCGTSGTRTCNASCTAFSACAAATETCNGCDDDGNGAADETFACALGSSRGCTTSCGSSGTQACDATCGGYGACAAAEACNGCDDDGDGATDEGFTCAIGETRSCTTSCATAGTQACNGTCSGFGSCAAPAEICGNGCDDDGDGSIDEGCPPANDACAEAVTLTGASGSIAGTLIGATSDTTGCGTGNEVFYRVTVTGPSIVYLSTLGGATFDTRLSYLGSACGATTSSCADDSCGALQTHLGQLVQAGTHYFAVHTFSSLTTPGPFTLSWNVIPATTGDNVYLTLPAAGTVQSYSGITSGTNTLDPIDCSGSSFAGEGAEDVYWWLQCPSDSRVYALHTCDAGTTYDTAIWLTHQGAVVGCNDDDSSCVVSSLRSRLTTPAVVGAGVVQAVIDGYSGAGSYVASITF